MEDAGNYRDRFSVGNCLNVFSRNCVVSPLRKNKEEQHRITGEVVGGRENVRRGRTRRAEEIAKKEKKRRGTKEMDEGAERRESLQIVGHPLQKGVLSRPGVPSLRTDSRVPSLPCTPVHLQCPPPIVRENYESRYFTSHCAHDSATSNVVYFLWNLNKTANNRESQINVDCRGKMCSRTIS